MTLEDSLTENVRLRVLNAQLESVIAQHECLIDGLQRQLRKLMLEMATETAPDSTGTEDEANTPEEGEDTTPAGDEQNNKPEPPPPNPSRRRRRRRSRGPRRKPRRKKLPPKLERICDHHPLVVCPYCDSTRITQLPPEVGERYDYIPARVCVRKTIRGKGRCCDCNKISTMPMPPTAVPHGSMTAAFLAHLAYSKCGLHLPLARIGEDLERVGVVLAKSTLCDAFGHVANLLEPIYDRLKDLALSEDVLHLDGTGIKVLEPNGPGSHGGQIAVYCTEQLSIYQFTEDKRGTHFEKFLRVGTKRAYQGNLVADSASNMAGLYKDGTIFHCGCWQHAREKFDKARASSPLLAEEGIAWISTLFEVEDRSDEAGEDAVARQARRQRESVPRLEGFRRWMAKVTAKVLPDEALAKAVGYCERQWKVLTRFTTDGRIPLTNNLAERELGVVGRGRKNWLFAGSDVGGERLAYIYTVVRSCQRMGIDPFAYLSWVLPRLSDLPVNREPGLLRRLLPMVFKEASQQAEAS